MPVYSVEGKLGTGKTKFCVWRAQQALRQGRRVASNVDLRLDFLVPEKRSFYVRIPDKPTPQDFEAIGHGNPDSYDEEKNGILILDELGTWLNSRNFQDKSRGGVIDWLIHARKLGWDVYLIVQDSAMIDRQVRESLIEYQCKCMRFDKVKIPVIGWFLKIFVERWAYLPRMHMVAARVGTGVNAVVAERWTYRGDDLHAAYDTRQIFRTDYPHGPYSVMGNWHIPPKLTLVERLRLKFKPQPKPQPKPKLSLIRWVQKLPPEKRIPFMRQHGLLSP